MRGDLGASDRQRKIREAAARFFQHPLQHSLVVGQHALNRSRRKQLRGVFDSDFQVASVADELQVQLVGCGAFAKFHLSAEEDLGKCIDAFGGEILVSEHDRHERDLTAVTRFLEGA